MSGDRCRLGTPGCRLSHDREEPDATECVITLCALYGVRVVQEVTAAGSRVLIFVDRDREEPLSSDGALALAVLLARAAGILAGGQP